MERKKSLRDAGLAPNSGLNAVLQLVWRDNEAHTRGNLEHFIRAACLIGCKQTVIPHRHILFLSFFKSPPSWDTLFASLLSRRHISQLASSTFNESACSLWHFLCWSVNLSAECWPYKSHRWHIWGTLGSIPPFLTCDLIPLSAIAATHELLTRAALARRRRLGGKWGNDLLIQGKVQLLCWKQLCSGRPVHWRWRNNGSEMVSLDLVVRFSKVSLTIWGTKKYC